MSVVFTAGKKSAGIVKGRDEEQRRPKRQTSTESDCSVCFYKPSEDIIVWNPKIDGKEQSIALQKSSMNIWFEDERLDYNITVDDNTSRMDFLLLGKKAVIINFLKPRTKENAFELQIEGEGIPRMMLPPEWNN
ncbi:unnamed protein product [Hymenolepis diminuta]|uniref:CS domain-containing protein n=1 Tax=Hymenolepis diminuta TaxID=6216 RepID=A0A0R3SU19_HYMDI|nr:unnamed protein product [Hymenolepis diminuta]VUZ44806.1 unnamed protein product [Hymenolepis diminuta]